MIYQHANKRSKILPIATFHTAHLVTFALPISMPRFKGINLYQNMPKIKLFLQKMQNPFVLGARPPDPRASSGGWKFRPQVPKTSPSLRISGYAPGVFIAVLLF